MSVHKFSPVTVDGQLFLPLAEGFPCLL